MEKITSKKQSSVLGLICATVGHTYSVTREISPYLRESKCKCCGREVSNNLVGKYELLTIRKKENNSCLLSFIQKKNSLRLQRVA